MARLIGTWEVPDLNALANFCRHLLFNLQARKMAIYGELGAGKTTMVKLLGGQLGISAPMTSPTFGLLNEYETPEGAVYHFDLYRLGDEEELLDLGFEEYLENNNAWIFIEWPELVEPMLPEGFLYIYIQVTGPESRKISVYQ